MLTRVLFFVTPWNVARQAPLFMEFSRQVYWSRLPFPTPGDLPDPGIEPESPVAPAFGSQILLLLGHMGSPYIFFTFTPFSSIMLNVLVVY